jgi:hypothetical protein
MATSSKSAGSAPGHGSAGVGATIGGVPSGEQPARLPQERPHAAAAYAPAPQV